ncbi:ABC transporter permease [Mycetocola spongiae]|uniref:ABC transporter permease n=1 Tax=Mycetocola spongiae TaxID=2859226 RepID=UPI001CF4D9F0|nr:iron chelate uptake ABC transporter family permease subunit [Mycetocola spongiae]UCR88451.1 iron chelate uptake ABC transporter family permease subunit [Mycetocola spongiae]
MFRLRRTVVLPLLIALTVALIITSLLVGGYDITLANLFTDPDAREMFFISRIPRTLALIFAAVAMSVCGVIMQAITQNKFVEPTTVGSSQWAGLGILVMLILAPNAAPMPRMIVASVFAFIGTMLFMFVLRRIPLRSSMVVPLVGIMLGAVVGAITTFIAGQFNLLQSMSSWASGGFSGIVRGFYEPLWATVIVAILAFFLANRFTVAGLGRDLATNIGLNYERTVLIGILMVALATGVTSVVVGFIPFLGLVVPNIVSMLLGDDLRRNLPWVAVVGICFLLACDLIGRVIVAPMEIPASVILGFIGAAVFIGLVLRQQRRVGA